MVPGTSVQVYAEERIALMLEHTYDAVVEEIWWPDLMRWYTSALGEGGVPVTPPSAIRTPRDIKHVFYANDPAPLPLYTDRDNPNQLMSQGTRPMFWDMNPSDDVLLRVLPYGTIGDMINVRFRTRVPKPFMPSTDIPIDEQLMVLGATYDFLEDDATSVGASAKFAEMFNARLKQLRTKWNDDDIYLGQATSPYPDGWIELS